MTVIYCYSEWDAYNNWLTVGFMSSKNHTIDDTVFDSFETKSFEEGMKLLTALFKHERVNASLLNQDNDNWSYVVEGDNRLQFNKIKTIINSLKC